ncbi:hypothetical protein [Cesiribacter sp. SM1]|uniref:hypothetical protein n=1 Tax=Cesiribacter sp. SM1 TaxID=2861196 RepID=UPI001CD213A9|nr:hypothetical protein [Cesiribacter sp. SM1]
MNSKVKGLPEGSPVLRVATQQEKATTVASYRKGWQLAQRMLEQWLQQTKPASSLI